MGCSLCRVLDAAEQCGRLDARDDLDVATMATLSGARRVARDLGHDEADVDDAGVPTGSWSPTKAAPFKKTRKKPASTGGGGSS